MKTKKFAPYLALLLLLLCGSCAGTSTEAVWRDPYYRGGSFRKLLVMGVTDQETLRHIFEDTFAARLSAYGAEGVPSYRILPEARELTREEIEGMMRQVAADGILITRLVKKETVEIQEPERVWLENPWPYYPPPSYRYWPGYYYQSWEIARIPARTTTAERYHLETNVYRATSGELVWSALTTTLPVGSVKSEIDAFVDLMIRNLAAGNLL